MGLDVDLTMVNFLNSFVNVLCNLKVFTRHGSAFWSVLAAAVGANLLYWTYVNDKGLEIAALFLLTFTTKGAIVCTMIMIPQVIIF